MQENGFVVVVIVVVVSVLVVVVVVVVVEVVVVVVVVLESVAESAFWLCRNLEPVACPGGRPRTGLGLVHSWANKSWSGAGPCGWTTRVG